MSNVLVAPSASAGDAAKENEAMLRSAYREMMKMRNACVASEFPEELLRKKCPHMCVELRAASSLAIEGNTAVDKNAAAARIVYEVLGAASNEQLRRCSNAYQWWFEDGHAHSELITSVRGVLEVHDPGDEVHTLVYTHAYDSQQRVRFWVFFVNGWIDVCSHFSADATETLIKCVHTLTAQRASSAAHALSLLEATEDVVQDTYTMLAVDKNSCMLWMTRMTNLENLRQNTPLSRAAHNAALMSCVNFVAARVEDARSINVNSRRIMSACDETLDALENTLPAFSNILRRNESCILPVFEKSAEDLAEEERNAAQAGDENNRIAFVDEETNQVRVNMSISAVSEMMRTDAVKDPTAEKNAMFDDLFTKSGVPDKPGRATVAFNGTCDSETVKKIFQERSIFQQYRAENERIRTKISNTHSKGTPDYCEKMREFTLQATQSAVHAFFTHDLVSPSLKATRQWLQEVRVDLPEIVTSVRDLSPFGQYITTLRRDLCSAFMPGQQMEATLLGVLTAPSAFWHHNGLRPSVLYVGGASGGKSYTIRIISELMPPGTVTKSTYSTAKVDLVGNDQLDMLLTQDEVPSIELGVDPRTNRDIPVEGYRKDMLTTNVVVTRSIVLHKDEKTGEVTRRVEYFVSRREVCMIGACNDRLPDKNSPILLRYTCYAMHSTTEESERIEDLMKLSSWTELEGEVGVIIKFWRAFNTLHFIVEKAIEAKAIQDVNMDMFEDIREIIRHVARRFNIRITNAKIYDKLFGMCRVLTIAYAISVAACSEIGITSVLFNEKTGKQDDCRITEDVALRVVRAVEPYLVMTREIGVFVFSLMRFEIMPEVRQEILQFLHNKFAKSRELLTAGTENIYVPSPVRTVLNPEQLAIHSDASYVVIRATSANMSLNGVAQHISERMNIQVDSAVVLRELHDMRRVVAPVTVHVLKESETKPAPNGLGIMSVFNSEPSPLSINHAHVRIEAPLIISYRAARQFVPTKDSSRFSRISSNRMNNGGGSGGYGSEDSLQSLDSSMSGGGGGSSGGYTPMSEAVTMSENIVTAVAFDYIKNPASAFNVVAEAVAYLSHAYMATDTQQFVLSMPAEFTRLCPVRRTSRLISLPHWGRLVTLRRNPERIRRVGNPKCRPPVWATMSRYFALGERGEFAARSNCVSIIETAPVVVVDADTEIMAFMRHHFSIGIPFEEMMTPAKLHEAMIIMHENSPTYQKYKLFTTQEIADTFIKSWEEQRESELLDNFDSSSFANIDEVMSALEKNGVARITSTLHSGRRLTDAELADIDYADENMREQKKQLEMLQRISRERSMAVQKSMSTSSSKSSLSSENHSRMRASAERMRLSTDSVWASLLPSAEHATSKFSSVLKKRKTTVTSLSSSSSSTDVTVDPNAEVDVVEKRKVPLQPVLTKAAVNQVEHLKKAVKDSSAFWAEIEKERTKTSK